MNNQTRRLPFGIQDFIKIREEGCVYIDKTERIYELITNITGPLFLSRPRRFGKSLLCSTLAAVFACRRDLFGEIAGQRALAIDKLDWEWKTYPVIKIDLAAVNFAGGKQELLTIINGCLQSCETKYDIPCDGNTIGARFRNLIESLHLKFNERVVVIIDEYDNPLLSTINKPELHEAMLEELKGFYSVLKSSDEHLKFTFLTGVTKFSQVSVFSSLNNLKDISLNPKYNDLCGFTQEEVEQNFAPEIEICAESNSMVKEAYLDKLKYFYNGYRFSQKLQTVYNPFGLLNHFSDERNQKYL